GHRCNAAGNDTTRSRVMSRAYNVIDADGHILEPLDLWEKYMDPKFRDRAPKIVKGENGKERLVIEEHQVGIGRIAAVGARQGVIETDPMTYKDGKPGGFDPHKRIPDMDGDGIDAAFLYPTRSVRGRDPRPAARRRHLPCLQPLAGRLLQPLSRPAVRG